MYYPVIVSINKQFMYTKISTLSISLDNKL